MKQTYKNVQSGKWNQKFKSVIILFCYYIQKYFYVNQVAIIIIIVHIFNGGIVTE